VPTVPPPLGARWLGGSTTFAVHSAPADAVELCLFDEHDRERRVPLARTGHTWWAEVDDAGPGTRYGLRARGPEPMDPAKLLVDPYARLITGEVHWTPELLVPGVDSAPHVPRSVVTSSVFDWGDDRHPRTAWSDTVAYELHVRGFTKLDQRIPERWRGTYRGLAHPAALDHLCSLGVTAVELLPVHHFVHDRHLVAAGLRNYWGYNPLGWFAPHAGYAAGTGVGAAVTEFKQLVRALHGRGLEVWLDVVYNHTAEGGADGPLLSLRGLDAAAYYVQRDGHYVDDTGCGNTIEPRSAATVRLVLDSLRHWVTEYHVDGFRFDLATVLGREGPDRSFDPGAALFDAIAADPVLAGTKLIAEPWDLGRDGYHVGGFPVGWTEWNGHFRDAQRDFWRGRPHQLGRFAHTLSGTADAFRRPGRTPHAGLNFVTCHDGFTLADLVSYEHKRNEANREHNRDGTDDNRSWNGGVEGPTDDPVVRRLRARQQRNLLASTVLAAGVPMLCAGDESGRTQHGNNNAYCQDNELSWIDWEQIDVGLRSFVRWLLEFRRAHPVLRTQRWATGVPDADGVTDVGWYNAAGRLMAHDDWHDPTARSVAVLFDGRVCAPTADSVYVVANADPARQLYRLPPDLQPTVWRRVLDTSEPLPTERQRRYAPGERIRVESHSLVILTGAARAVRPAGPVAG
jgi:glycogen operon protein